MDTVGLRDTPSGPQLIDARVTVCTRRRVSLDMQKCIQQDQRLGGKAETAKLQKSFLEEIFMTFGSGRVFSCTPKA